MVDKPEFLTAFRNHEQKVAKYNRLFRVCESVKDPEDKKYLDDLFSEIMRLNREWDKRIYRIQEREQVSEVF